MWNRNAILRVGFAAGVIIGAAAACEPQVIDFPDSPTGGRDPGGGAGDAGGGAAGQPDATGGGRSLAGGSNLGGAGGTDDCSEQEAAVRQPYRDWSNQANDFRGLAGSSFSGYIEGGNDLRLTISDDQVAELIVGEAAAPPVTNGGYLCDGPFSCDVSTKLLSGGTYAIFGATFGNNRVRFRIQPMSVFDPWCALQTPVPQGDCSWSTYTDEPTQEDDRGCAVGGESVECGWFKLAFVVKPCLCTTEGCTGYVTKAVGPTLIELSYDPAEEVLEGTMIFENGQLQNVRLLRDPAN